MINFNTKAFIDKVKNIRIGNLFYNNKFVAIFSVVISFIIWIIISSNTADVVPVTISDIPVDIQLSDTAIQDGLRVFSGSDITARVDITGNRLIVGRVTKNDIQVTAAQSVNTIMSPGNYMLELSAKKVGVLRDYQIISNVKPSMITVMVDRYRESTFDIETDINFTTEPDYFVGSPILSSQQVVLSGPETEISKIKKVKIVSNISEQVNDTITLKLPIIMYDAYDHPINIEAISSSIKEVEVSVPVLMKKEVDILASFSNIPQGIDIDKEYKNMVKVTPSRLEIAGPRDVIENLKSIKLDDINFDTINFRNHIFNLPINIPQGCRSLNNTYSAELYFDMHKFKEKSLVVNQFKFKNVPSGKKASIYNESLSINIIAPINRIHLVRPSDIVAQIDFKGKNDVSGSMELPITFSIKGSNSAWISGVYYANVSLS